MPKVLIVDDHAVVRIGVRQILEEQEGRFQVVEAESAAEAMEWLDKESFDALILDVTLPDQSGLELLEILRSKNVKMPILMLSVHAEEMYAVEAMQLGASGYLRKDSAPKDLTLALNQVLEGKTYIQGDFATTLASSFWKDKKLEPHDKLSTREKQVFQKILDGKMVSEIATELNLSIKTISTYRGRICTKLGLKNNAELFRYAAKKDLLS